MIRYYCDRCGREMDDDENAKVFRRWDLCVDELENCNLMGIIAENDFLLCDECFEKMSDFMEVVE